MNSVASQKEILKDRIEAKKSELESEYHKLKPTMNDSGNDRIQEIENKLSELRGHLESGWGSVSEATAKKLNEWLS
jgi:hypothetical protein